MKKLILIAVILLIDLNLYAQVSQQWAQRYNGAGNTDDVGNKIIVDAGGNVYTAGFITGNGTGNDGCAIKYNSAGVQQWVVIHNHIGSTNDAFNDITTDASGNVYVTGFADGGNYFYTAKYNSSGVVQWQNTYHGNGGSNNEGNSIAIDGSGNVIVAGFLSSSTTSSDLAVIKYNSAGVLQWQTTYNGSGNGPDEASKVKLDGSGNIYVTGSSSGGGTFFDYITIKYNSAGTVSWLQRYNGPGNGVDIAYDIAVDGSGNVYVTGYSTGNGTGYDFATIKYNSAGTQQWATRYTGAGTSDDRAFSIALDAAGNVYAGGWAGVSGHGIDYTLIKYNPSGVQQWIQQYNGAANQNDYITSIATDNLNNIYVTGYLAVSTTVGDWMTIKYNSSGVRQWTMSYNGPANSDDKANSVAVDNSGNVFVAGASTGNGTNHDITTIKYSQPVGLQQTGSELPDKFSLGQNYPNPFNPSTKISFSLPNASNVQLIIFDILGREVSTVVDRQLQPGTYEADWNADGFPSGVYFYKLAAGDFVQTKKMALVK